MPAYQRCNCCAAQQLLMTTLLLLLLMLLLPYAAAQANPVGKDAYRPLGKYPPVDSPQEPTLE